jgi:hypothetical protein
MAPLLVDIFGGRPFTAVSLTEAINIVPNQYGRINELGLFRNEPVPTTQIAVRIDNGILNLLPTRERGAPPSYGMPTKRNMRSFIIPHIPHEDQVTAGEVQDVIAAGGGVINANVLENVAAVVNRKLIAMRNKHAITLEHMRMATLKGQLIDNDGSVIYNWFTEFGITEKVIDFAFSSGTFDALAQMRALNRYMEVNALGETVGRSHVLASPEWMDAFLGHASVKGQFQYYNPNPGAAPPTINDLRRGFEFGNVFVEEYNGTATQQNEDKTVTVRKFIPTNEARAFPEGTNDTFVNYWAPPDFIETVNVANGEQVFVKQAVDPMFGRFVQIHTQSNPLAICKRPALLVRLTKS